LFRLLFVIPLKNCRINGAFDPEKLHNSLQQPAKKPQSKDNAEDAHQIVPLIVRAAKSLVAGTQILKNADAGVVDRSFGQLRQPK
jgi:hypothetical protein